MDNLRTRAIIPYGSGLILIHRIRNMKDYYVFPGGGLEGSETIEECAVREVNEEVGIIVTPVKEVFRIKNEWMTQIFIICKYVSGEIGSGKGPEFHLPQYKERGLYIPTVINIKAASGLNLYPIEARDRIISEYNCILSEI